MGGCLRQICEKPYCSRAVRPENLTVRTKFSTDLAENLTARHFGGPKIYRYNKISVFARFSKTLNQNVRKTKGIIEKKKKKLRGSRVVKKCQKSKKLCSYTTA